MRAPPERDDARECGAIIPHSRGTYQRANVLDSNGGLTQGGRQEMSWPTAAVVIAIAAAVTLVAVAALPILRELLARRNAASPRREALEEAAAALLAKRDEIVADVVAELDKRRGREES